ncbi:hypothetical protein [Saccharomonospora viridis]|jgi:hypothetical protein|uniref:Uncharacterized protein n=1 Tax=Saccharomonospora viridis TaxID=1852 RepID=A0A837DDR1_9PSEU|nr:hypothetical protein [Saccharomonospora viridis]KHF45098.1 hypothetical protein MINT15_19800 [Saccharomonospora viridis]SFP13490.1 hypothetical protein SAMN02982918_1347 [Saccharomonospora viridis]
MSNPLESIELSSEQSYGEKVMQAIPHQGLFSEAKGLFEQTFNAASDGDLSHDEIFNLAVSGQDFISSCSGVASGIMQDPIGSMLTGGLEFLISICQPLQDLVHMVSGDGPALENAATNFAAIGEGIEEFSSYFAQEAVEALVEWEGESAQAAAQRLAEFAKGIKAVAGEAGNIAELLQISSIVMKVIEDFIMALLTELIMWLVMIWVPALASSVVTFGGSTAAAASATGVRVAQTTSRATQQVSRLRKLLDKIKDILVRVKEWLAKQGKNFREAMDSTRNRVTEATRRVKAAEASGDRTSWSDRLHSEGTEQSEGGAIGSRVSQGFGKSMRGAAKDNITGQFEDWESHWDSYNTAQEYGSIGEEQSKHETSDQLNF